MLGSGDDKKGEGYVMKSKLNDYRKYINSSFKGYVGGNGIAGLAPNGYEAPMFVNDIEQKHKDFAHLNFESTPMVAALASISEKESRILQIESELLSKMIIEIGGEIIHIEGVTPVVRSSSNTIVIGTAYKAVMFMAATSSSFKPEMKMGSQVLPVDANGRGLVEFKVTGGAYDKNGVARKVWRGTIRYPKADGTDSLYTIEEEYFVVKPAIEVKSAAVQPLYKDCDKTYI